LILLLAYRWVSHIKKKRLRALQTSTQNQA